MILTQKQEKVIIKKKDCQILITFTEQESLEVKLTHGRKIFTVMYNQYSYKTHYALTHYFPTLVSFFAFISTVNEQFILFDHSGWLVLRIFAEELQERIIEIKLEQQGREKLAQMFQIMDISGVNKNQSQRSQIEPLRIQLMNMSLEHKDSMRLLTSKVEHLTKMLENKKQFEFLINNKHPKINILERRITNEMSDLNQVRWTIIGSSVSAQKNTFLQLKVHKLNWLAIGFCHKRIIQKRNYSRFNGCGQHGAFVMDNTGWVYSHDHQSTNYQQLGFSFNLNDKISIVYNPRLATITFINQSSWKNYDLSLRHPQEDLYPCIACNMETDIEVIDYIK